MASLTPYEYAIQDYTLEHCWFPRFYAEEPEEGSLFPLSSGYGSGTFVPFLYPERHIHATIWKNIKTIDWSVSFSGTVRTIQQITGGNWRGHIAEYSFSESGTIDLYPNVRNSRRAYNGIGIGNDPFPGVLSIENAVSLRTISHFQNADWSKAFENVQSDISTTPDLEVQFEIERVYWIAAENKYGIQATIGMYSGGTWAADIRSLDGVGDSIGVADFLGYGNIDLYSSRGSETISPPADTAGSWWTSGPTVSASFAVNDVF